MFNVVVNHDKHNFHVYEILTFPNDLYRKHNEMEASVNIEHHILWYQFRCWSYISIL